MRFLLLHIILLIGTAQLQAQINLVPNPSFEEADTLFNICNNWAMFDTINTGKRSLYRNPHEWYSALHLPYYYNDTCKSDLDIANSRTGSGRVRLINITNDPRIPDDGRVFRGYKENIGVRLKHALVGGNYYKICYYVHRSFMDMGLTNVIASSSMGAHFAQNKLNFGGWTVQRLNLSPIIPQVMNPAGRYLMSLNGWDKVEGLYKAQGGEEWLTLGDFGNRNHDTILNRDLSNPKIQQSMYYAIDDVSLTYFDTTNHYIDTIICSGQPFSHGRRPDWDSCVWFDGSRDSSKLFTQSGVYWLINYYAGFTTIDTINLNIRNVIFDTMPPRIHMLGICAKDSVLLTTIESKYYIWSNGITAQKQQYVGQSGKYYVTVYSQACVVSTDTFQVKNYPSPQIVGLGDTAVCFQQIKEVLLDAGVHKKYLWLPTGDSTRIIVCRMPMSYLLTVTDSNGCRMSKAFDVGDFCNLYNVTDTTICRGRSFLYHKRPDWDSCIWYDGSSDSSKVFTQSGVYWVTHFYAGFTATDTIKLTIADSLPVQTYYLGYCVGDSVLLTARPAQQYIWNNSSTQQTQVVKQAATYYVTGNTLGCLTTDTFHVSEHTLPTIAGLKDTVVCFDDIKKIELDAGLHNTYLWQPTGETTRTIYSTMAMLYNLTVTDTNGCKSSQQVAVNEQCNLQLYVPNAFSPNNDGVNEIFKISINPNHIKQFEVYNRWGQLIAQNQTGTWDGKDAPQGVYVIILYYINDNGQEQRYSGNVTLMR